MCERQKIVGFMTWKHKDIMYQNIEKFKEYMNEIWYRMTFFNLLLKEIKIYLFNLKWFEKFQ